MGWTGHELPNKNAMLFTRGGVEGIYIEYHGEDGKADAVQIEIPERLLLMLVADQVRSSMINQLEQASDAQVLGLPELVEEEDPEIGAEGTE